MSGLGVTINLELDKAGVWVEESHTMGRMDKGFVYQLENDAWALVRVKKGSLQV